MCPKMESRCHKVSGVGKKAHGKGTTLLVRSLDFVSLEVKNTIFDKLKIEAVSRKSNTRKN
jgi:hypothetical protein